MRDLEILLILVNLLSAAQSRRSQSREVETIHRIVRKKIRSIRDQTYKA
jgi:hypothetical protein